MPPLARPVKPATAVRRYMDDAARRMQHEHGYWMPPRRTIHEYTYPNATSVTIRGGSALNTQPVVDYDGPLGGWQANLNPQGVGKPRQWLCHNCGEPMHDTRHDCTAAIVANEYENGEH